MLRDGFNRCVVVVLEIIVGNLAAGRHPNLFMPGDVLQSLGESVEPERAPDQERVRRDAHDGTVLVRFL